METLACGKWKHWGPFRTSELVRPCLREWRPSSCPSRSHGALGRKSPLKRQGCVFVLGVPTFFVVSKGNQTETVAPFWGSLKQDTPSCCFCPQLLSPFCRLPYLTNIQDVPIFEARGMLLSPCWFVVMKEAHKETTRKWVPVILIEKQRREPLD